MFAPPSIATIVLATLPVGHLLLWAGLLVLTVAVIVLVVSKWGKSRPMQTCGVLSLLAHVLLACLATIVRIVSNLDQVAEGPPIRVRLVSEQVAPAIPLPETRPLLETEPTPPVPNFDEPKISEPVEEGTPVEPEIPVEPRIVEPPPPIEAPPIDESQLIEREPSVEQQFESAPQAVQQEVVQQEIAPAKIVEQEVVKQSESVPWSPPVPEETTYIATTPTPASPFANRQRSDRLGFVLREGGSRETEAAVRAALGWLAATQSSDGSWNASRYGAGQEQAVLGHNRSGAGARSDTGVSSLALLAYLGAGHSHQVGDYHDTVQRGLQFLINSQSPDGNLGASASRYAQMYCHSMSTFALAEAMAITGDSRLEPTVRRAIDFSIRAQHVGSGGWRYRAGQSGDTSQLGWQLLALRSAELAGLAVPHRTWNGAEYFLTSVARGRHGGLASYTPTAANSRTMTAEALYCRQMLAKRSKQNVDSLVADEATQLLLAELPGDGPANLYYWYYATLALHQQKETTTSATRAWETWNAAMKRELLARQVIRGEDSGSWHPNTVWAGYGGRVYSTALPALCLEVYYRYLPSETLQEDWIATQPENPANERVYR